jgi:tRNA-dihydrouridine synthase
MYSGRADRNIIKKVKNSVSIPVIGNGDINSAADAVSMMRETGCDGVMIARGCLGKPWLFGEIKAVFEGKEFLPLTFKEIGDIVRLHISLQSEFGGSGNLLPLRKQLSWYTKGISGSAAIRRKLNEACEKEEFYAVADEVFGV